MNAAAKTRIAVEPVCWRRDALALAVERAGAQVVPPAEASGLVWADPTAEGLALAMAPTVGWVQLPFAGIEPFADIVDDQRVWTCGKGVYSRPVAEHVLALLLAGQHDLIASARATTWGPPLGRNLDGCHLVVLGAGGITAEFLALIEPFRVRVTVVRRTPAPLDGADDVIALSDLASVLPTADVVILALALTPRTRNVIDADALGLMKDDAWLINVARGAHVDTAALVSALTEGRIGGACLDVTEPEPLPDGHPLWDLPNCLITPHVGNTPLVGLELLARRVEENTRRWMSGENLLGLVDPNAGY